MTYSPPSVSENQKCRFAARGVPRHRQRLGTGGNVQTVNVGVSHRRQPRCAGDAVRAEVLHVRGDLRARLEVVGERVRGANREIENATGEERSDGRPGRHLILVGGHGKVRGERAARQHAKRVRRGMRRAPECHVHHVVSRLSGARKPTDTFQSRDPPPSPSACPRTPPSSCPRDGPPRISCSRSWPRSPRIRRPRVSRSRARRIPSPKASSSAAAAPSTARDATVDSGDTQPSGEVAPGHPNDTFERVTAR